MIVLTREQHCLLAGIDVETFKSMKKRGQLPTADYAKTPEGDRGYTPTSTLMLLIAIDLFYACGLSRDSAAIIATAGNYAHRNWPAIASSSLLIAQGKPVENPVMCGLVERTKHKAEAARQYALSHNRHLSAFCGTVSDLARLAPIGRMVCTNVSEIVARMRLAAERANIDLEQFWREG
jgi:hypothetical protein